MLFVQLTRIHPSGRNSPAAPVLPLPREPG